VTYVLLGEAVHRSRFPVKIPYGLQTAITYVVRYTRYVFPQMITFEP